MQFFQPEHLIQDLSGDMSLPKFGEYKYYHKAGSKTERNLFWVRDIIAVYKNEIMVILKYE